MFIQEGVAHLPGVVRSNFNYNFLDFLLTTRIEKAAKAIRKMISLGLDSCSVFLK